LSPFPFVLALGQDDNERIMGAKLRDYAMEVQWNTELGSPAASEHVAVTSSSLTVRPASSHSVGAV
jgi:hypothetical protein